MTTALDPTLRTLSECSCCGGLGPATPGVVFNRPGLSAIAYRSGTWHEFKSSLVAALAGSGHPALAGLATRADDDFSIALLDAVAAVADVLTFYQERMANESYLRTATERLSVLELARLIGYELKPGVAARTLLAFTVEDAPGAPRVATIDVGLKVQSVPGHDEKPQTFEAVEKIEARAEWNAMKPKPTEQKPLRMDSTGVWLAGTATNLKIGDALLLMDAGRARDSTDENWGLRRVTRVEPDHDNQRTRVEWERGLESRSLPMTSASPADVYALRTRASLFGYNAIDPKLLPTETRDKFATAGGLDKVTDPDHPRWKFTITGQSIALDAPYPSIRAGSWVVLARPEYEELYYVDFAAEAAQSDYGLSGKITQLSLATGENLQLFSGSGLPATMVFGENELLLQEEGPIDPPTLARSNTATLTTDVGDVPKGRRFLIAGKNTAGNDALETILLDHVEAVTGTRAGKTYRVSRLVFGTPLTNAYQLETVTIYGNVALASHGETVNEVVGGGDAGKAYQRFTLRQPPLTFVRDTDAAQGAASTLALRVNDLLWQEVPWFYGRGPAERVFATRRDDDGNTVLQFGDGVHGARLPTGRENVRASYRKGIGTGGNVKAGQLTTLLTRPLGLKGATNPRPATGGDDPEPRDSARENAPLTVLTLDRVVSLRDYEGFARAYAGIAKALATWSWDGERHGVLITVAGPDGAAVADDVLELLSGAIRKAGDPFVALRVGSYRPAAFTTTFKVKTDPVFEKPKVFAALDGALRAGFGFQVRAFGQSVTLSEVIATLQNVAGVIAVDVDTLVRKDGVGGNGLVSPLPAALPQANSLSGTQPAELLTLAADSIVPGEMT